MTPAEMTSTTNPLAAHFRVDARVLLQLGRQSIRDHTTALIELVKNAYDADATLVEVEIAVGRDEIRIVDNGTGMDRASFERTWLRIGYSDKRKSTKSPSGTRRVVGEKGVGRISADRIAGNLELRTKPRVGSAFSIRVPWDSFDTDGRELSDISLAVLEGVAPRSPSARRRRAGTELGAAGRSASGTELIMTGLRQGWTREDVEVLAQELRTLISPFNSESSFRIALWTDIDDAPEGMLASAIPESAEFELRGEFRRNILEFTLFDRSAVGRTPVSRTARKSLREFLSRAASAALSGTSLSLPRVGPLSIRLFYLSPSAIGKLAGSTLTVPAARSSILGVRLYRDNVRVRPYGEFGRAEGDWLELARRKASNPAGVARAEYRIPPTSLAGAVFISRDSNRSLNDSAGREGLIENDAFRVLKTVATQCVAELESFRHERVKAREKSSANPSTENALDAIRESLRYSTKVWTEVAKLANRDPVAASARAIDLAKGQSALFAASQQSLSRAIDETRLYRGLSALGITASVFGHETQTSIDSLIGSLREVEDELADSNPRIDYIRRHIQQASGRGAKVQAWGAFAVSRVRVDKRKSRSVNLEKVLQSLCAELEGAFTAAGITLRHATSPISIRAFEMDIEALLLNLLTNAYSFVQQSHAKRIVAVTLTPKSRKSIPGAVFVVSDSGPGVSDGSLEQIWTPLFTTKRDASGVEVGTGLGLAIVDSVLRDLGGIREVDRDPKLGGARFTLWIPTGER